MVAGAVLDVLDLAENVDRIRRRPVECRGAIVWRPALCLLITTWCITHGMLSFTEVETEDGVQESSSVIASGFTDEASVLRVPVENRGLTRAHSSLTESTARDRIGGRR